jgi:hypothetical protein
MFTHGCVQGIWESILIIATLVITNFLRAPASLPRIPYRLPWLLEAGNLMFQCELGLRLRLRHRHSLKFRLNLKFKLKLKFILNLK